MDILKEIEQTYMLNGKKLDGEELEIQLVQEYMRIPKADSFEMQEFEELLDITLPEELKAFYNYHNGSGAIELLSSDDNDYRILSLASIVEVKVYFQNKDEEISNGNDERVQNYIQNKRWIPFAASENGSFLMLDYAPTSLGKEGQIIEYKEADGVVDYAGATISEFMTKTMNKLKK